ncbi:DUF2256 domain-containing protein [Pedobacter sp. PACM 27299]
MKNVKKQNLPAKICKVCNRCFTWHKKWEKNWDDVQHCLISVGKTIIRAN